MRKNKKKFRFVKDLPTGTPILLENTAEGVIYQSSCCSYALTNNSRFNGASSTNSDWHDYGYQFSWALMSSMRIEDNNYIKVIK